MAASQPTLYKKLRTESDAAEQQHTLTMRIIRWVIIVLAIASVTAMLPGSGGEKNHATYSQSLLGTVWSQESVYADYTFPVLKTAHEIRQASDSAADAAPIVFRVKTTLPDSLPPKQTAHNPGQYATVLNRDSVKADFIIIRDSLGADKLVRTEAVQFGRQPSANVIFLVPDVTATSKLHEDLATSVGTTKEIVRKSDVIIRKGQRVDDLALRRLLAYRNAELLRSTITYSYFAVIGSLGHAIVIIGFVVLFLRFLRPVSYHRVYQLATLLALPVLSTLMGWLSARIDTALPLEYLAIIPALAMIITILYEERTALMLSVAMSISVGAARGDDYAIMLVLLVGGIMGVYSGRDIHSRTQIFTAIVAIFSGMAIALLAIDLERSAQVELIWPKLVMAGANAILSPLLTFAVILLFERTFNVATDLRLEEFNNVNHPLLRLLNERAPGTYQHTMAVARLAEAAADAISANALLTRVGTYFHDIGKIEKSEYFVENQIDTHNKHDHIPPKRSAAIIRQHVQDGIELAKEYKLPERITKFIPMHHGTILIKHFHAQAMEQSTETGIAVDEQDFRYPGPKPDSREAGIVMLADAAEALSRLVDTSQRQEIESAVHSIIMDRVFDGQLTNTMLTIHDLDLIQEAFVKNLLGSSHQRVRYKNTPTAQHDAQ